MSKEEKKEERKRRDKDVDTESFEAGRIFALLKRRDPSLYEEIVSIMESENKEPSDIVHEAFALYRDYKYMVGVDPRALAYAIRVVQVFQQRAIELMAFSIEYFTKLMGAGPDQIAEAVARKLSEEMKEAKEEKKEGLPKSVKEKIAELTATTMMRMVEMMLAMMPRPGVAPALAEKKEQSVERKPKIVTSEKKKEEKREGGET